MGKLKEQEQKWNGLADNIKDRTGLVFGESVWVMKDRGDWERIVDIIDMSSSLKPSVTETAYR